MCAEWRGSLLEREERPGRGPGCAGGFEGRSRKERGWWSGINRGGGGWEGDKGG